uniref:Uncharacterized protein n=1 Tax=Auxenochlorella protothecoides TaxID=3075 RepID=A0A1D1ZP96_AUXPR
MDVLCFEPDTSRLASLLDTDEDVLDFWSCLDPPEGPKPYRASTPANVPLHASAPLAIAGGRRALAVTLQNDSAESAATMLGSSYGDREDPGLGRALSSSTWVPQAPSPGQWPVTYEPAPQYSLPPGLRPAATPAQTAYQCQYYGAPAPGPASCPCCSLQYMGQHAPQYAPQYPPIPPPPHVWGGPPAAEESPAWQYRQQLAAAEHATPLPTPMSALEMFDAAAAAPPPAAVPGSEGSTMHGGRSRGSSYSGCDQGSVVGAMETAASLDILSFEDSEEEALHLDDGGGAGLGAWSAAPGPGDAQGPRRWGPHAAPPAPPAPRGHPFTQHHGGRSVPASPAGAPRGLALRATVQLKRSASARRLGGGHHGEGEGDGSAHGGASYASYASGPAGLAPLGGDHRHASSSHLAAAGDGRPVRQAARRSMALAAATAAAEAWEEDGAGGGLSGGEGEDACSAGLDGSGGSARGGAGGAKKKHNPWSAEETRALVEGVRGVGAGKWAEIKRTASSAVVSLLSTRSAVDLKDKWRNLTRVARLPKAQLKARLAKGSEVPLELILEVKELLDATPRAE